MWNEKHGIFVGLIDVQIVSVNDDVIFYPFLQIVSGKFDQGLHIEILQ